MIVKRYQLEIIQFKTYITTIILLIIRNIITS